MIHSSLKKLLMGVVLLLGASTVLAEIKLTGELTQGSLIRGEVVPGSRVWLNETPLRVTPNGHFVFGIGRDGELSHTLRVETPAGQVRTQQVSLRKRDYRIQRIEGVEQKHVTPPAEQLERIRQESALTRQARARDIERLDFLEEFIWPTTGRISGVYGSQRIFNGEPRQPHYGVDVAAPTGTPVVAPASGVVTLVHPDMFFSGGTLILDHGYGVSSTFIHLSEVLVQEGAEVKQGDLIARVGATGRATGPHLHWSMNWFNTRLDPATLVPPMEAVLKRQALEKQTASGK